MTGVDELSIKLGALEESARRSEVNRKETNQTIGEMNNKLDQVLLIVPTLTSIAEQSKKNAEKIDNLESFKNKAIGASIVGGGVAGFLASNAKHIIAWIR